jgi:hypothetical protein
VVELTVTLDWAYIVSAKALIRFSLFVLPEQRCASLCALFGGEAECKKAKNNLNFCNLLSLGGFALQSSKY